MINVSFKFNSGDKVTTIFGDEGVIDSCSYSGPNYPFRYYVLLKGGQGSWFDENQITAAP